MTLPDRDRPFPAAWTVSYGLEMFLAENGYDASDYDRPWTPAKILGVRFAVPNPPRHRWLIMRHDLHHIATGFGTDLAGEGQISAWEWRRGVRPLGLYVGAIVTAGVLAGLVRAPRRTLRAWRRSGRGTTLFHRRDLEYDALLEMTIGDLRTMLDLPAEGVAVGRRGLNGLAPT